MIYTARLKKAIEASGEVEKPVIAYTPSGKLRPRMAANTGRLQQVRAGSVLGSSIFASFAAPADAPAAAVDEGEAGKVENA